MTLHQLLDAVHDDLVDLSEISQALEDEHPALRNLFRLPENRSQQNWIDMAAAVPDKLTPHLALFEEYGLEPDFCRTCKPTWLLNNAAFGDRSGHIQSRAGDTRDIDAKVVEGKKLVKKLDVFAGRRFKANPTLLGSWFEASTLGSGVKAHRKMPPSA